MPEKKDARLVLDSFPFFFFCKKKKKKKSLEMTDLTNEINLITSKLSEKLSSLEAEFQRWNDYKVDYDALENQLHTLPDNTTKSAMVRVFVLRLKNELYMANKQTSNRFPWES
jgi:glycosylphosphatidylinositol transamidase (GPIT) subunit GPI8